MEPRPSPSPGELLGVGSEGALGYELLSEYDRGVARTGPSGSRYISYGPRACEGELARAAIRKPDRNARVDSNPDKRPEWMRATSDLRIVPTERCAFD